MVASQVAMELQLQLLPAIVIEGDAVKTIFPKVEEWLDEDGDRWRALEELATKRSMRPYTSVVDFIFCTVFPAWRHDCFSYYRGCGPLLRYLLLGEKERAYYEAKMLLALEVAYQFWCRKRAATWYESIEIVNLLAA